MTVTWNEKSIPTVQELESPAVSVTVVSIRAELLSLAVSTAKQLTLGLRAQLEVLAPYAVPFPLDLYHPPVAPSFLEDKLLSDKALLSDVQQARILLCRDEGDAIVDTLAPNALVVMATKKRWWRTKEESLAARLRKAGYQVVLAYT